MNFCSQISCGNVGIKSHIYVIRTRTRASVKLCTLLENIQAHNKIVLSISLSLDFKSGQD